MKIFNDGETVYSVDFKLKTAILKKQCSVFDVNQIDTFVYSSNQVYATKNEAIEEAIKALRGMKE